MNSFREFSILLIYFAIVSSDDLYEALGVSRSASQSEIKSAYRRNAMKWHPDRNPSKEAEDKFLEITKAYEVLSNPSRRSEYDTFGTSDLNTGGPNEKGPFAHQHFDPDILQDVFSTFFQPFHNYQRHKKIAEINFRSYRLEYLPASRITPLLLLGYSNICFSCQRLRPLWSNFADELPLLGIAVGVANIQEDHALREELRLLHSPSIVLVIDNKVTYFMGSQFTFEAIIDFVKTRLLSSSPSRSATIPGILSSSLGTPLVTVIKDVSQWQNFHFDWRADSRPRVLFIQPFVEPSLQVCLAAFRSADLLASAFINSREEKTTSLLRKLHLDDKMESLVIFKEDSEPIYTYSTTSLSRPIIDSALLQHSQLSVPRILSQLRLASICPSDGKPPTSDTPRRSGHQGHRHLCLILLLHSSLPHGAGDRWLERYRNAILTIPHTLVSGLSLHDKLPTNFLPILSPAYIFIDKQKLLLEKLTFPKCVHSSPGSSTCTDGRSSLGEVGILVAFWRMSSRLIAIKPLPRGHLLHLNEVYPANITDNDKDAIFMIEQHQSRLKLAIADLVLTMPPVSDFVRSLDPEDFSKSHLTPPHGWNVNYLPNVDELVCDELASPLWLRIKRRLWELFRTAFSYLEEFFIDPISFILSSSIIFVILFTLSLYLITKNLFGVSETAKSSSRFHTTSSKDGAHVVSGVGPKFVDKKNGMRFFPLTPATYTSLVISAPVGQLTVILCTDSSDMGQRLENQFSEIVSRLSGDTLLTAACLNVVQHPQWLAWFLEAATNIPFRSQEEKEDCRRPCVSFNPLNCRGTVISLNSRRRYFSIYHPLLPGSRPFKHTERSLGDDKDDDQEYPPVQGRKSSQSSHGDSLKYKNLTKLLNLESDDSGGQSSNSSETESDRFTSASLHGGVILERELLSGLDVWLDRLFEGSLRRYHVDSWPKTLSIFDDR